MARYTSLMLETVICLLSFHAALVFAIKRRNDARIGHRQRRGTIIDAWVVVLASFSIMHVMHLVANYFIHNEDRAMIISFLGDIVMYVGMAGFIAIAAGLITIRRPNVIRGLDTALFGGQVAVSMFFHAEMSITFVGLLPGRMLLILMLSCIAAYYKHVKTKDSTVHSKKRIILTVGLASLISGFFVTIIAASNVTWFFFPRLAGAMMQLAGLLAITIAIWRLPSSRELVWRQAMEALFIIYEGGILIHHHPFKTNDYMNPAIVASAIETIRTLLINLSKNTVQDAIDLGSKAFLVSTRKRFSVVLVAERKLDTLDELLERFTERFDHYYEEVLESWQGIHDDFKLAPVLVDQIFGSAPR